MSKRKRHQATNGAAGLAAKKYFDKQKINKAAYDAVMVQWLVSRALIAGAEELKQAHGFTEKQLGAWGTGTLARLHPLLIKDEQQHQPETDAE